MLRVDNTEHTQPILFMTFASMPVLGVEYEPNISLKR